LFLLQTRGLDGFLQVEEVTLDDFVLSPGRLNLLVLHEFFGVVVECGFKVVLLAEVVLKVTKVFLPRRTCA
jgi:hypothetical protein